MIKYVNKLLNYKMGYLLSSYVYLRMDKLSQIIYSVIEKGSTTQHLLRFFYHKMRKGSQSHLSVAISTNGYTVCNYT